MTAPIDESRAIGLALEWVSRILAISLVMILPGVAGHWLDGKLGTNFLALLGFGLGLVAGMAALLAMTRRSSAKSPANESNREQNKDEPR